jgi:hypothetical protein
MKEELPNLSKSDLKVMVCLTIWLEGFVMNCPSFV